MNLRRADWPNRFVDPVSRRIIDEIEGMARVDCDILGKPPGTIGRE